MGDILCFNAKFAQGDPEVVELREDPEALFELFMFAAEPLGEALRALDGFMFVHDGSGSWMIHGLVHAQIGMQRTRQTASARWRGRKFRAGFTARAKPSAGHPWPLQKGPPPSPISHHDT